MADILKIYPLMTEKKLFTIGHSTLELSAFIELLKAHEIKVLADVRAFPMSRRLPQFNKENLDNTLTKQSISYIHLPELGGRRRFDPTQPDYGWTNRSFAAYAQYLRTEDFSEATEKLANIATKEPTAIMCAEKLWWRCHRRMISDYMTSKGWDVFHIMETDKAPPHVTSPQFKDYQPKLF